MLHLSIIPDGNRRWALKNKLESMLGHQRGMEAIQGVIDLCIKRGIKYLSFYTFSLENFRRSKTEQEYLFKLLEDGFNRTRQKLIEAGVRVTFVGKKDIFPPSLNDAIAAVEQATSHLTNLNLILLFCYGSQTELAEASKSLAQKVSQGTLPLDAIDEKTLRAELWTKDIPDPDLIIRTGGVRRLSNLMLFQAAYAELMFLDHLWPEVTPEIINGCIDQFSGIKRNFGV